MSCEKFSELYEALRTISCQTEKLRKLNKDELVEKLSKALIALDYAEKTVLKQSDLIMSTTTELVKQCELTRMSISKENTNKNSEIKLFSDAVKQPPPLIVKNLGNIANDENVKKQVRDALAEVNVSSSRISKEGNLILHLPNQESRVAAQESLGNALDEGVEIGSPKEFFPKIMVFEIPREINVNSLRESVGSKDANLKSMMDSGEEFKVLRFTDMNGKAGTASYHKALIKCSKKIRNYIVLKNGGYLYLNLSRCRVVDKFNVIQCFHCYKFNHIADKCADKDKPPVCGRCAEAHESRNCNTSNVKCVNCCRDPSSNSTGHVSFSEKCPHYLREKNILMNRTDFSEEKN